MPKTTKPKWEGVETRFREWAPKFGFPGILELSPVGGQNQRQQDPNQI